MNLHVSAAIVELPDRRRILRDVVTGDAAGDGVGRQAAVGAEVAEAAGEVELWNLVGGHASAVVLDHLACVDPLRCRIDVDRSRRGECGACHA